MIEKILTGESSQYWKALAITLAGFILARLVKNIIHHWYQKNTLSQTKMLLEKFLFYLIFLSAVVWALKILGFDWKVLLGAAGVFTVAIGFAAQTSVSNLISGIFLMSERPFQVDDLIEVNGTTGIVLSIDFLSTRLRTFQNALVRVPNEVLMKAEIKNYTRFPIRRIDLDLSIAYKENMKEVKDLLLQLVDENPLCLDEPAPLVIHKGFFDSSVNLMLCVWGKKENFLTIRNGLFEDIKTLFEEKGIEIPFPQRVVYMRQDGLKKE